jgi:mRNA interferase MazF
VGTPVVGEIVVLPFPQTNLQPGKRRPAWVVANLTGEDLILCQLTSRAHRDSYAVLFDHQDCTTGKLSVSSFIRPNRLFTGRLYLGETLPLLFRDS